MNWVNVLLYGAGVYLALGLLFAVAFVTRGAGRIDPVARAATRAFSLVIFPGAAALWPMLTLKWLRAPAPRDNDHA